MTPRVGRLAAVTVLAVVTLTACGGGNPAEDLAARTEVYLAGLPTASGPGRVITLTLFPQGHALLVEKFIDRDPPGGFTQSATWSETGGAIELRLDDSDEVLALRRQGNRLLYEGEAYGAEGLPLQRVH